MATERSLERGRVGDDERGRAGRRNRRGGGKKRSIYVAIISFFFIHHEELIDLLNESTKQHQLNLPLELLVELRKRTYFTNKTEGVPTLTSGSLWCCFTDDLLASA